ncbi:MAG: hypothetical protein ACFCU3_07865 [Verrucomicrobiales bacterium]
MIQRPFEAGFCADFLGQVKATHPGSSFANIRDGVLAGYRDILGGRTLEFRGSLRPALREANENEQSGW